LLIFGDKFARFRRSGFVVADERFRFFQPWQRGAPNNSVEHVRQSGQQHDSSNDTLGHRVSSSAEDVREQPKTVGSACHSIVRQARLLLHHF
jgi:hypothetical protein